MQAPGHREVGDSASDRKEGEHGCGEKLRQAPFPGVQRWCDECPELVDPERSGDDDADDDSQLEVQEEVVEQAGNDQVTLLAVAGWQSRLHAIADVSWQLAVRPRDEREDSWFDEPARDRSRGYHGHRLEHAVPQLPDVVDEGHPGLGIDRTAAARQNALARTIARRRTVHGGRAVLLSGHHRPWAQYDRESCCPAEAELLPCCASPGAGCRCRSLSCRCSASICACWD